MSLNDLDVNIEKRERIPSNLVIGEALEPDAAAI